MSVSWEVKTIDQCTPREVLEFSKLRTDVFFLEQRITEEEIDKSDSDPSTIHIWVRVDGVIAGYVRVVHASQPDPADHNVSTSIGRLVVDADHRGQGIARGLMVRAIDQVGLVPIVLHAQTYVHDFYASLGFEAFGDVFDEAGLDHIRMIRPADKTAP